MAKRRRVALLVESARSYGRGLLRGIADFIRVQAQWSIYLDERNLGEGPGALLKNWHGDGLLAQVENRRLAQAILDLRVPAVDMRGLLLDLPMPLIETDDPVVVRLAADHLLGRGFRQFAFCGFDGANYSDKRSRLFTQAIHAAGYTCDVYHPPVRYRTTGTLQIEQHNWAYQDHLARWLKQLPRPVGLMTCNDIRGQQVLNACREVGIAVPDEMAVLGVDNDELLCDLSEPPLSSVVLNTRRIGYEAAVLLEQLMDGQPPPEKTLFVPPVGIVTRRSTDVLAMEDRDIADAVRFIREHACEGIKVEDVLKHVPLSRSVLERRFLRLLGRTPKAEILRVQLERVKQLLTETELPLSAVAARSGFEHPEYLCVVFKNKMGQTAGAYRAQVQQKRQG